MVVVCVECIYICNLHVCRFVKQGVSDADMAEHLLKEWVLPRLEVYLVEYMYHNMHSNNFLLCVCRINEQK